MLVGNTVRLQAEFKDFDGTYFTPDNRKVRIYDGGMNVVKEAVPVTITTGKYYYDHILSKGDYAFEFYGEIGGFPVLSRAPLTASERL